MSGFAIFRVEKLKRGYGKKSVGKIMRHLEKHSTCADISRPERSHMNKTKDFCSDYRAEIKKAIEKHNNVSNRALRSDASVCLHMVFTMSPDMEDKISPKDFYQCILQFYDEAFKGCQLLKIQYDADESVGHFHLCCIPSVGDKLSASHYLGSKADLSHLQDRFAEICKPIGLKRGKCYVGQKNKPHHIELKEHKQNQIEEIEQLKKLKRKLQNEICQELSR